MHSLKVLTACLLFVGPAVAQPTLRQVCAFPEPSITVTGTGRVTAAPDRVSVRVGASIDATSADDAQQQVNVVLDETIRRLREELEIPSERIQTVSLSVSAVYDRPQHNQQPKVVGYRATNIIRVELDDVALTGRVIDVAISSGANRLDGVSFELRDDRRHRVAALRMAAQDARSKAEVIAQSMGVRLGNVIEASEIATGGLPRPVARDFALSAMETAIQPGEVGLQAALQVKFRILVTGE